MKNMFLVYAGISVIFFLSATDVSAQEYWWKAPILKYVEEMAEEAHSTSPHYWTFGGPSRTDSTLDQTYLYTQDSNMSVNFSQYVVEELRNANSADEVAHRWAIDHIGRPKGCTQFSNRVVIGNGGEEGQPFTSYPDDMTIGSGREYLLEANVSPDCDTLHFNHDGTLLYTNHYVGSANRSKLHRYRVTGSLEADGQAFTLDSGWQNNGTFNTAIVRLRNFIVKYIGGKDLIYYGEGSTLEGLCSVYVLDADAGIERLLIEDVFVPGEVVDADIVNIKIAGVAAGDPHLYVMGNIAGVKVYKLTPDGMGVENGGNPVAFLSTDDLNRINQTEAFSSHARAFEVTDDQQFAFFSAHNANANIFVVTVEPGVAVSDWIVK
ncbi:MAG: hypothetical protein C4527_25945 [Candidatus Omnitrophota bacterium]|jgi:hypothetical protein|nr:MAG: hypothetical protein C4527_25945 [Candidatus Omnitrophota bacterium]